MKKFALLIVFALVLCKVQATHITGGEMIYKYMGPGAAANTNKYEITLRLFRDEASSLAIPPGADMPTYVWISLFNNDNLQQFPGTDQHYVVNRVSLQTVPVAPFPPCMINAPSLNYTVGYFTFTVDLPVNQKGYTGTYNTCCRVHPMINVDYPLAQGTGSTYICRIPGTLTVPNGDNSSPVYDMTLSAICFNKPFTYSFHATDPDGDSLVYSFTDAFDRGTSLSAQDADPLPPGATYPYYQTVPYINGFTAAKPLGNNAVINQFTGVISGTAPSQFIGGNPERYVVAVVVKEYRNGVFIADHRKDFIVNISDCDLASAGLQTQYVNCDNFDFNFSSTSSTANIQTYYWDFGDGDTSSLPTPAHTYAAAGVYTLKLVINRNLSCSDSSISTVKVFPGFNPDFTVAGQCKNTPIQFNDITTATYGAVNKWQWNFGDTGSPTNTSTIKSPTHTYATSNSYDVTFIVSTSVGCIDTVLKTIQVTDQPALTVLPKDTLICIVDTLQLNAVGTGSFVWTPNYNISSITSNTPLVSPDVTTTYRVTLTDPFGCVGKDSVKVTVVSQVTQFAPADTTICKTDGIVLKLVSDAANFLWTEIPAGNTLSNPGIKNPVATPVTNTTYHVVGSIGKCIAQSDIRVNPVPYPDADAGADQTICLGGSAQLNATGGSIYSWSPAAFLNNRLIPNPVSINPTANIKYVVTVTDILGCPKPVKDTVIVTVAVIKADAGPSDTSVILGQPLLLQATGSTNYLWSPAQWLTNIGVSNPVSLPQDDIKYFVKVYNDQGCFDIDSIRVHLFRLESGMYVPSAFTPNGDGNNDYLHPIIIGMKSLDVFMVYNRWGQLLYRGTDAQKGWDGTFAGKGQDPATYVWYAEGTTYKNIKIRKKGYAVLIR